MDDVKDRSTLSRWSLIRSKAFGSREILGALFGQTIGRVSALRSLLHVYPKTIDPTAVAAGRIDAGDEVKCTIPVDQHVDGFLGQFTGSLGDCYSPGQLALKCEVNIFELIDCGVLPWLNVTVHRPSARVVYGRPRSHKIALGVPVRKISGTALAVMDMPSGVTNYYHFFEDLAVTLRALRSLNKFDRVALLFSKRVAGYQRPILDALVKRYPQLYIEYVERREIIRADRLLQVVLRESHPICRFALKEEWREIGSMVREHYGIGPSPQTRSVYFSRNNHKWRRLGNEDKLLNVLAKHRCEIIAPEALAHSEQVRLMTQVQRLVGVEGAALVNIVFADKPITLLEIFPLRAAYPFYVALALQLGHKYRSVMTNPAGWNERVTIDADKLDQALRATTPG